MLGGPAVTSAGWPPESATSPAPPAPTWGLAGSPGPPKGHKKATGREAWRRAEVVTGFAGSAACKIPFDMRKECKGARQRELINNQEYSVLFSSKRFININEPSRAAGEVFKPHSVFIDKEMKALAEGQSFQK